MPWKIKPRCIRYLFSFFMATLSSTPGSGKWSVPSTWLPQGPPIILGRCGLFIHTLWAPWVLGRVHPLPTNGRSKEEACSLKQLSQPSSSLENRIPIYPPACSSYKPGQP